MGTTVFGIRHHGPGCARSLVTALDALQPAALLIEGPPDADEEIPAIVQAGMTPPVALLVHQTDDPRQSVFYPFAEFSPEWQALRWAVARGVPVRFMDFPWQHRFALRAAAVATGSSDEESPTAPLPPSSPESPSSGEIREDPLSWLARADGYSDSERWWNDRVEERGEPAGLFSAVLEAMTALRTELALSESLEERRREAWMRRVIRETQRDVLGEVAVVCGAWHAPALARPPKVSADNELLKGLPKIRASATWVPWTFARLCSASGYGAGIESPGWYEHLWHHRHDPQLTACWLTRVGRVLRDRDLDASTAQVIDGVRLAEHLAAFRGRPIPGLPEMNEAALAVFCHGDRAPLRLVARELLVGDRLGTVPEGLARVPLQQDIEAAQKRLRLKPSASRQPLELDLREPNGLERSRLLHRLALLSIPWGRRGAASGGKGTFRENWTLEWKPEFAVAIIDAARFGNTLETAAAGAVASRAAQEGASLDTLCGLLESALLADLPAANTALLARIQDEAARGDDVLRLMRAVPALARLARYGNVRQTDTSRVLPILDGFVARIHAGLSATVGGLDDEAAAEWSPAWRDYHDALGLLESDGRDDWLALLARLLERDGAHPLLAGLAARLLFEADRLESEKVARVLARALSRGQEPGRAAAWIEGFLSGHGAVLVHDPRLLPLIESWVASLPDDAFTTVLPLLRRTFATFAPPERARIAARLGAAAPAGGAASPGGRERELPLDAGRARAVVPVVLNLLGRPLP
jgi:hypothetical protein